VVLPQNFLLKLEESTCVYVVGVSVCIFVCAHVCMHVCVYVGVHVRTFPLHEEHIFICASAASSTV
jgi:hypothetical protein